jgi:hypothetical protein
MDFHLDIRATSRRRAVLALPAQVRFGILYELL